MKYFAITFASLALATTVAWGQQANQTSNTATYRFASAPQETDDQVDWKQEFEKLEFRLRELENDFVRRQSESTQEREAQGSSTQSTIDELNELSEAVESLSETVGENKDKLTGAVLTTRKKGPTMELFGRIHTTYVAFGDVDSTLAPIFGANPEDSFGFRRVRIGVKGNLHDNTFYKIETEFADPNNFEFRDVILGVRNLPFFNTVTIGNHKRPYSLDQWNSSNANVFLDRPFVADAFNDSARRLGVSSAGFSDNLKYNWHSGVYNLENVQSTGAFTGDDYQLEIASRLAGTPWYDEKSGGRGYFHWAVSGANRFPDGLSGNNQSEYSAVAEAITPNILDTGTIFGAESETLYGLETVLNVGALQITAEYQEAFVDRLEPVGPNLNFHGGYIYAAYTLTGEHMPWNRKVGKLGQLVPFENFFSVRDTDGNIGRGWGAWQIAARYSYLDLTDEDIVGGDAESVAIGLNWWWNRYTRMQFNYVNGDVATTPGIEGNFDIFALQFETFF